MVILYDVTAVCYQILTPSVIRALDSCIIPDPFCVTEMREGKTY